MLSSSSTSVMACMSLKAILACFLSFFPNDKSCQNSDAHPNRKEPPTVNTKSIRIDIRFQLGISFHKLAIFFDLSEDRVDIRASLSRRSISRVSEERRHTHTHTHAHTTMESADNALRMLDPQAHLDQYIQQGLRYDGRGLSQLRSVHIKPLPAACEAGNCVAAVSVTMRGSGSGGGAAGGGGGGTSCICHIALLVGTPSLQHPCRGDVQFDVSLQSRPDSQPQARKKPDECVDLEALLYDVYVPTGAAPAVAPLEQLCLTAGQRALRLHVSLFFQSVDGNLQDCAVLAVWHALQLTRLPAVGTDSTPGAGAGDGVALSRDTAVPLALLGRITSHTYALWPSSSSSSSAAARRRQGQEEEQVVFLADPTQGEEQLVHDTVTVVRLVPATPAAGAGTGVGGGEGQVHGVFFNAVANCGGLASPCSSSGARGMTQEQLLRLLEAPAARAGECGGGVMEVA